MNVTILVGIIVGGMLGALTTRTERAVSPKTHLIIGSIAGATIGGLGAAVVTKTRKVKGQLTLPN